MQASPSAKPLSGRTVLVWLIAFFAVVLSVNAVMTKLAIDTLPGTDVDSAYKASLAYNSEIHAAQEQAARRWSVTGHVSRNSAGGAAVDVTARDAADVPLTGLAVSVHLSRPTDKRADRVFALGERGGGRYRGEVSDVSPGQWDVVIEADRGAERLFLSRNRVILE
jgi:nitrogen fixation protein FixH